MGTSKGTTRSSEYINPSLINRNPHLKEDSHFRVMSASSLRVDSWCTATILRTTGPGPIALQEQRAGHALLFEPFA